ncbi:MAG: M28 family peptidase [Sphingomonas sp.]|uniref:M28 family metallopeptidase n=1 Tax=Sphingomonas sp. TaxID=28214 RepID=UPI0025EE246D|nr:M28 family metallopeptidase [Sphingomonas sp.]MBX3565819.1 M28 family peptidase [Sphingomonas sp.]
MRLTLTALLLLASGTASAQSISLDTIKDVTKTLSSDEYEGRAPTTPAEDKTLAYIVKRFEAAGLKPGNKGGWFQNVPLVELTAQNVSNLEFTGGKTPVSLAYRKDMVIATYRVVPKIEVKDSDVVFVGYGINAPERGWNDYAGLDVKGKTVVILVNDPDWMSDKAEGPFNGRAMTYYGRWTYKYEEAARQGAAAAIIVHDTFPASYPWGVVQSSWTGPQLEQDTPGDHMDQSLAIGWITNDAAKALFASAGKDLSLMEGAAMQKGFKAVPLGLKASVNWDNAIKRQASKNVVGILPGTARPDEVVLYSAHWDHLGRCDAVDGDDICNGAVDNASGIGGLVALAEAHHKEGTTKRSLVFLAVTAEESGLLGSKFYAENPVYPLAKTVGGVNMDSLNTIGKTRDFVLVGAGKSELEDIVKPFVAAEGRVIVPEPRPEGGGYYRSDHFSFAKLGVPMLYGESGDDLLRGGKTAGGMAIESYTMKRYHKPQDEYDANWDWSGAMSDLNIYYALGRALADGDAWPNWYPDAEFRGIRDKSRAKAK